MNKLLLILTVLVASIAFAEHKDHPCMADAEKLCAGMKMGDGKFHDCMKSHEADLSAACKDHMKEMKGKMAEHHPCMAEGEKLCAGMKPGDGKWGPCMKEHESSLSPACKAKMSEMKMKKHIPGDLKKPDMHE